MSLLTISVCFPLIKVNQHLLQAIRSSFDGPPPSQLIIIDQSSSPDLHDFLAPLLAEVRKTSSVVYVNSRISGLVFAKALAVSYCTSDILVYGEDDLILPKGYIGALSGFFSSQHSQLGCCCLIDEPPFTALQAFRNQLFKLSPFLFDPRQTLSRTSNHPIETFICSKLYGGSSAWRTETLRSIPFHFNRTLHYTEDVYYSLHVNKVVGYPCTTILTRYSSKHFSVTNQRRYDLARFRQRTYEEFSLISLFAGSFITVSTSLLLLLFLRLCEVVLCAPFSRKPALLAVLLFSLADSLLPPPDFSTHINSLPPFDF
jgi:hypothetical protein